VVNKFNISQKSNLLIMREEEIISFLQSLGLNKYEADAYFALLSTGPAKAIKISNESGIPQSKIYFTLDSLIDKNLAEVSTGRPKEYRAVEPYVVLKNILSSKESEMEKFKSRSDEVGKILTDLAKPPEIMGGIWSTKSKKWMEFFDKIAEMLDKSESYVYAISRDFSRTARLAKAIKDAKKRGIKIRVIGMEPINENNYLKAKFYCYLGVELRYLSVKVHPRIVVIDGKEVLIRLDHDSLKKQDYRFNSIWTQDPSMVFVIDSYMKGLWEKSTPIKISDFKSQQSHLASSS